MIELYRLLRPTLFKHVIGQQATIKRLTKDFADDKRPPHSLLFTGPTGTGKTTLARIVAKKLKADTNDIYEMNCASESRGIDFIRELRQKMRAVSLGGGVRVFILDECFPAGTLVDTPDGPKPIETLRQGDQVFNAEGIATISKAITNQIELERIVCVHFEDGSSQMVTEDHLWMTTSGWVESKNLAGLDIFRIGSYPLNEVEKINKGGPNEETMPVLPSNVPIKTKGAKVLRELMFLKEQGSRPEKAGNEKGSLQRNPPMRMVPGRLLGSEEIDCSPLPTKLRVEESERCPRMEGAALYQGMAGADFSSPSEVQGHRERKGTGEGKFKTNEGKQSLPFARKSSESESNQKGKGNSSCLERREGGKRHVDSTAIGIALDAPDNVKAGLATGACDSNGKFAERLGRFSDQLQGRYRLSENESGNRSRWEWSQMESRYLERCEENGTASLTRVASVTSYERRGGGELFRGCEEAAGANGGGVPFYDLSIEGHPSYHIAGKLVHNCQQLTADAQDAALKLTEDVPEHCWLVFCSSDPQKLKATFRTRLTEYKLQALAPDDMMLILKSALKHLKAALSEDVADKLIDAANGSGRSLLVMLQQIIGLPEEDQMQVLESVDAQEAAVNLAALLIKNPTWQQIGKALEELKDDPEKIRRGVLGYATAILLKQAKDSPFRRRLWKICSLFRYDFYVTGRAGLIMACYEVVELE